LVLLRIITRELTLGTHDPPMFALTAIQPAPPERIPRYSKYVKELAPPSVQKSSETLMKTVLKDAFVDGLPNQGRAEMLLEFLEMRFNVPDDSRERVERCDDEEQIKTWGRRVPTAASVDEVGDSPSFPHSVWRIQTFGSQ
jgi:hypothetical protein